MRIIFHFFKLLLNVLFVLHYFNFTKFSKFAFDITVVFPKFYVSYIRNFFENNSSLTEYFFSRLFMYLNFDAIFLTQEFHSSFKQNFWLKNIALKILGMNENCVKKYLAKQRSIFIEISEVQKIREKGKEFYRKVGLKRLFLINTMTNKNYV